MSIAGIASWAEILTVPGCGDPWGIRPGTGGRGVPHDGCSPCASQVLSLISRQTGTIPQVFSFYLTALAERRTTKTGATRPASGASARGAPAATSGAAARRQSSLSRSGRSTHEIKGGSQAGGASSRAPEPGAAASAKCLAAPPGGEREGRAARRKRREGHQGPASGPTGRAAPP